MIHKYRAEKTSGGLLYFTIYQIFHSDYDPENETFGVAVKIDKDIWEIIECKIGTEEQYICQDSKKQDIYENDIIQFLGYEVINGKQTRPLRKFIVGKTIDSKYKLSCLLTTTTVVRIGNIHENLELMKVNHGS